MTAFHASFLKVNRKIPETKRCQAATSCPSGSDLPVHKHLCGTHISLTYRKHRLFPNYRKLSWY